MRANQLVVRCYAELHDGMWNAYCLDFSLGAQADTFAEARKKIDEQIEEYVHDALAGQDREHAVYLMTRRAPLSLWLKYYFYKNLAKAVSKTSEGHRRFKEVVPLVPASCH